MAGTGTPTFTRVMVIAPSTRVDVALPVDVPACDLVPMLLDMVGERSDDGGSLHDGWRLSAGLGTVIEPASTLAGADVLDGSVLHLTQAQPTDSGPIFDDVVDAIATSVRERTDARAAREVAGSVASAAALIAALILLEFAPAGLVSATLAALAALVCLGVAIVCARFEVTRLGLTLGAGAVISAGVAAHLSMGRADTVSVVVLVAAAVLTTAVLTGATTGLGTTMFSAVSATAALVLIAGLLALVWSAGWTDLAIAVGTGAVALVVLVPAIALRLARLPMPVIPTSADDLAHEAANTDFDVVRRRAALAVEYVVGLTAGCALIAAVGVGLALARGDMWSVLFAVVVTLILLLRVRSVTGRGLRLWLLSAAVVAVAFGVVMTGMAAEGDTLVPLAGMCLVLAAFAVGSTVLAARRMRSPMGGRSLDILENLCLIAVLPLSMAAIDLFATARSL